MLIEISLLIFFLLLACAASAVGEAAHAAHDLQSDYFNMQVRRIERMSFWGAVLSALGVAGVACAAVALALGIGYAVWVAAFAAGAAVLIANYFQKITRDAARARFKQIAQPLLGDAALFNTDDPPEESVDEVVDAVEKAGLIEMDEHQMITGIIHLDRTLVRDIMIPRTDVVAIEVKQSFRDALDLIINHAVSRVPVYQDTMDHIVGVVYAKDLLRALRDAKTDAPLRTFSRPARFVPETQRVDELLQELQKTKVHLAIVVDEYGGTAGIVTIEDILEEIVGEIQDEYDTGEEPLSQKLSDTEFVFNARATIVEVNETMELNLPDESDTLGGLVLLHLEKMPKVGDLVRVNEITFTVTAMTGRRIKQVRVLKGAASPIETNARQEEAESEN